MATSNGVFLPLLPPAPAPGTGWSVKVIRRTDFLAYSQGKPVRPIAQIFRFQALTWSPEISGEGIGSITLSATDPIWAYPLADGTSPDLLWRYSMLFAVYRNGQWRGEFLNEKVTYTKQSAQDGLAAKTVTISGPGTARALNWARVFGPYYPKPPPKDKIAVYQYKNLPVMASWLQLLAAAQARGTIGYIRPRFTATRDSAGAAWDDTPPPKTVRAAVTTTIGSAMFTAGPGGFTLTAAGTAATAAAADKIAKLPGAVVTVTGHTDNTGAAATHYQTGLDRANTVSNALQARHPMTVNIVSKGATQPVASNRTAAGRAKNRRAVISYTAADTAVDTIYTPQAGAKLMDLLQALTSGTTTAENRGPIHCEWSMGARFGLDVRAHIGTDRSRTVIFHEGSTFVAAEADEYDRTDIANLIAVQDPYYAFKIATHQNSRDRFGQREMYTALTDDYAPDIWAKIAATQRDAYQGEVNSTTIQILPGPNRTPWADFTLGDWIGVGRTRGTARSYVDKARVTAITVTVDAGGQETYELTLDSTRQARVSWLQLQIDALTRQKKGAQVYVQNDKPGGGVAGDFWTPATGAAGTASEF